MPATSAAIPSPEIERPLHAVVVTNIYPTPVTPTAGTFIADHVSSVRAAGVLVDCLHVPRGAGGRLVYWGLADRVSRLVTSAEPDLVHVMYGGVMADIVTRTIRHIPVLVSFYGTDLLGGSGRGVVHGASRRYGVIASRRAAVRANGIIVKSRNLFDALPARVDRSRVWIVPDGVDLKRFRPLNKDECRAVLAWNPERRHVLFPASPERPEKRFELAQAGVALLRAAGVDVDLHVLAGVGPENVPTWLNASDVLLLTSAHEGSPNVVKEALACNVPVVSVDVGDVRERIEGIDGCSLVDPIPDDIAAKVGRALRRDRPIDTRTAVADLSLERVAATLCEIYARVAGRRAS